MGQKKRNESLKKDRKQILFLWRQRFKDSFESESRKLHPSPTPSPDSDSNPDSQIESGLGLTTTPIFPPFPKMTPRKHFIYFMHFVFGKDYNKAKN